MPHIRPSNGQPPRPRPPPRRRTRTMSFSIRAEDESGSKMKKLIIVLLVLLTLFLVGTVIVLSSVSLYFALPAAAFLDEVEVQWNPNDAISPLVYDPTGKAPSKREYEVFGEPNEVYGEEDEYVPEYPEQEVWDVDGQGSGGYWMRKDWDGRVEGTKDWTRLYNATERPGERIPRLIHQTWKDDQLPPKWRKAWKECREGMPDYDYMLWTDDVAHDFIKTHYPHHLQMYESYKYPIMRADAIRYYVLHHFGGVYMDLDIGCRRRLDGLLQGDWDAILPVTKPVGVSNDLIFSAKGSPFMDHTVHALPAWNHDWFMNYPTVMFSTGPMFLSGQYAIYSAAHPVTETYPRAEVRILPKSLYGKNAPPETVPHSFFSHFYGSSWHAEDANFVTFLGAWGKYLMYIGMAVVVFGIVRLVYMKFTGSSKEYRLLSLLPTHTEEPTSTSQFTPPGLETLAHNQLPTDIASALRRAGNLILTAPAVLLSGDRRNNRRRHGLLYFVPALFQPNAPQRRGRTASEASQIPMRRSRRDRDRERERLVDQTAMPDQELDQELESDATAPPPYDHPDQSICSSPEQMEKKLDFDEDDGYLRSDGSISEYEQSSEWEWKDSR